MRRRIQRADISVVSLLLYSQTHNARQLDAFLKHFIATNYGPMKKRDDFDLLQGDNLKHIEANQWPPVSYLKELAEYEKKTKRTGFFNKLFDIGSAQVEVQVDED